MGMDIKVNPEYLDQAIIDALNDWNSKVLQKVNYAVRDTAKDIAKMLHRGGPYQSHPGGTYASGWEAKRDPKGYRSSPFHSEVWTVWNKTDYRLTHLLEKGHALRRGGRTYGHVKSFPHIAPMEDVAAQVLISRIEKNVKGLV